jgi:aminoglycoside phosphotransferase family enzyme
MPSFRSPNPANEVLNVKEQNRFQSMVNTLQLNGKGEHTQQAYSRAARMLAQFHEKSPDLITEEELRDYFLD